MLELISSQPEPDPLATEIRLFRELLTFAFEGTAEWRSELVARFPDDARNQDAASELSSLMATVKDVPDALMERYLAESVKDVPDALMERYIAFCRAEREAASEKEQEMLRSIGFRNSFENAAEFVSKLVADCEERLADEAEDNE